METGEHSVIAKVSSPFCMHHMNGGLGTCRKYENLEYAAIPVRQSWLSQEACNVRVMRPSNPSLYKASIDLPVSGDRRLDSAARASRSQLLSVLLHSVLLVTSSSGVFLSHQISISHQPLFSQQYFSLRANQHQPPVTASRTEHLQSYSPSRKID